MPPPPRRNLNLDPLRRAKETPSNWFRSIRLMAGVGVGLWFPRGRMGPLVPTTDPHPEGVVAAAAAAAILQRNQTSLLVEEWKTPQRRKVK
mmetsp:Transcript_36304/g.61573  ORF Transcript_36304/g.61573 Transcript_36304/m.61573 type:complete len:91 (+) Transcript_36304:3-275(+)